MRCWILTIGDELINGLRVDTNTAWLAARLSDLGVEVERAVSLGDEEGAIRDALAGALAGTDLVIVSGGLGPTQDDRTKPAVAAHFGVGMTRIPEIEEAVRTFFATRGRSITPVNLDQALVPDGFAWHINPRGTAPGLLKEQDGRLLFVLPGVPGEMRAFWHDWLEPLLQDRLGDRHIIRRRWFQTTGIGESDLFNRVGGLEDLAPTITLAYLPSAWGVALYVTGKGEDAPAVEAALAQAEARIVAGSGDWFFARGDVTLAEHLAGQLRGRGLHLAVAESCTGGLLADTLTNVPGASEWLDRTWVTYSNRSKTEELGVPAELIAAQGAVSEPVARAMAEGARQQSGSDFALATTGIAGPTGGTPEKPVGLVYLACAGPAGTVVRRYLQGENGRRYNKQRAAANALDLLRRLVEKRNPFQGGWESPG